MITGLSFPQDRSVKDGIDPTLCVLSYTTVDKVTDIVVQLGKGPLLAKVDIYQSIDLSWCTHRTAPYRQCVGSHNRWKNLHSAVPEVSPEQLYIDPIRLAPKIISAAVDVLNDIFTTLVSYTYSIISMIVSCLDPQTCSNAGTP